MLQPDKTFIPYTKQIVLQYKTALSHFNLYPCSCIPLVDKQLKIKTKQKSAIMENKISKPETHIIPIQIPQNYT
jgi:hypothetical protein